MTSIVLFTIYLSPLSIVPMVADLAVLWGVLVASWTPQALAEG